MQYIKDIIQKKKLKHALHQNINVLVIIQTNFVKHRW